MAINEEQIQQVTGEIWGSMLNLYPIPSMGRMESVPQDARIGASVQITGGWEGAVRVDSSLALARIAAARFLGAEPDTVSMDQVRDAMGELANMSAGMIKNLLPAPSYLSLPLVADGREYSFTICKSNVESEVRFECEGEELAVAVLHRKYTS